MQLRNERQDKVRGDHKVKKRNLKLEKTVKRKKKNTALFIRSLRNCLKYHR